MTRFIRALIYGAFAAFVATVVLDWLDRDLNAPTKPDRLNAPEKPERSIDKLGDEAKQALLDELAAQV
ncbi:MAG: hypothetical protein BMS9Abin05_0933 [Rhodothermia bacterium]|nr:MAG: hypothetical protein BMS9Abin05_0933 [Rhodothermia bacterium]